MKTPISTVGVLIVLIMPVSAKEITNEIVMAEQGTVQLISIPQVSPGMDIWGNRYAATKIVLRSSDSEAKFTTFEGISFISSTMIGMFAGSETFSSLHQVWLESPFGRPTIDLDDFDPSLYHPDWVAWDSHLLMFRSDVGGGGGGGFDGIMETNDNSTRISLPALIVNRTTILSETGNGDILMGDTDAFFLKVSVQAAEVDLAYLVTVDDINANNAIQMSVGVFGRNLNSANPDDNVSFGFVEPLFVLFSPEPTAISMILITVGSLMLFRRKFNGNATKRA